MNSTQSSVLFRLSPSYMSLRRRNVIDEDDYSPQIYEELLKKSSLLPPQLTSNSSIFPSYFTNLNEQNQLASPQISSHNESKLASHLPLLKKIENIDSHLVPLTDEKKNISNQTFSNDQRNNQLDRELNHPNHLSIVPTFKSDVELIPTPKDLSLGFPAPLSLILAHVKKPARFPLNPIPSLLSCEYIPKYNSPSDTPFNSEKDQSLVDQDLELKKNQKNISHSSFHQNSSKFHSNSLSSTLSVVDDSSSSDFTSMPRKESSKSAQKYKSSNCKNKKRSIDDLVHLDETLTIQSPPTVSNKIINNSLNKKKATKKLKKDERDLLVKTDQQENDQYQTISSSNHVQNLSITTSPLSKIHPYNPNDINEPKAPLSEKLEGIFEWWKENDIKRAPNIKWLRLHHQGIVFPPPYKPHDVKMLYNGKPIDLPPEAEEAATFFAKHLETTHYQKLKFRDNFFQDFVQILNRSTSKQHIVQKFELCDFTPISTYLKNQSELRKSRTKEEKDAEKNVKLALKERFGYALVDDHKEPLANFMVEPPGIFLGRGDHPHTGRIKNMVLPENVTLNLSQDAPIPDCNMPGHVWGKIIHNQEVAWIATWTENILGTNKYVLFGAASSIRGSSDRNKFEIARLLKQHIFKIRQTYNKELHSPISLIRQRATALWVIDHLALRVGNEKKEDEADTVGCCSLRVEHIRLIPPSKLEFNFLGKDSMPYHNIVQVPGIIYDNFKRFCKKKKNKNIFDELNTSSLNKHLNSQMKGLTAKVFRTYNASITLQEELGKELSVLEMKEKCQEVTLRLFYNRANRQVAILCNHQRTVSKNHSKWMANIDQQIDELKLEIKELKNHQYLKEFGKGLCNELKHENGGLVNELKSEQEKKKGNNCVKTEGKDLKFEVKVDIEVKVKHEVNIESKDIKVKQEIEDQIEKKKTKKLPDDPVKIKKRIASLEIRLHKLEINRADKGEGSQVQNSTSKINYMDPRITVAWCKKNGLDLKRIFSKTLIEKFQWAIAEIEENPDFFW